MTTLGQAFRQHAVPVLANGLALLRELPAVVREHVASTSEAAARAQESAARAAQARAVRLRALLSELRALPEIDEPSLAFLSAGSLAVGDAALVAVGPEGRAVVRDGNGWGPDLLRWIRARRLSSAWLVLKRAEGPTAADRTRWTPLLRARVLAEVLILDAQPPRQGAVMVRRVRAREVVEVREQRKTKPETPARAGQQSPVLYGDSTKPNAPHTDDQSGEGRSHGEDRSDENHTSE